MTKINITIKQTSNKNSVQNVIFGDLEINKTDKKAKNIQNISLNSILEYITDNDKINIKIINKEQRITQPIKTINKGEINGK